MADPHATLSPSESQDRGCTCEFGCRTCGMEWSQMGNCPAWDPCPMGRAEDPDCPLFPAPHIPNDVEVSDG